MQVVWNFPSVYNREKRELQLCCLMKLCPKKKERGYNVQHKAFSCQKETNKKKLGLYNTVMSFFDVFLLVTSDKKGA